MAVSAGSLPRRYTYADLAEFPDDNLRREIIDGELFVNPSPVSKHQDAVMSIAYHLEIYGRATGGKAYPAPFDVILSDDNVVQPDVLFIRADHLDRVDDWVRAAPDLVVEVSSPTTRQTDRGRKRDLYERFGVAEYWFVDLDRELVEVYTLSGDRYPDPVELTPAVVLRPAGLPGLEIPVSEALGNRPAR